MDREALVSATATVVLQVHGKKRAVLEVPADADKEQLEALVVGSDAAARALDGKHVRRVVVVHAGNKKGRNHIVNFVV